MANKIKINQALLILGAVILAVFMLATIVNAQSEIAGSLKPLVLVREFSFYIYWLIIILFVFLCLSIFQTIRQLGIKGNIRVKLKLIYHLFVKDPGDIFGEMGQKDKNGTYRLSYDRYRKYHFLSQKIFQRTFALLILQFIFFAIIFTGLTGFNHWSNAQKTIGSQPQQGFLIMQK